MASMPDGEADDDRQVWLFCKQLQRSPDDQPRLLSNGARAALRRMYLTRSAEADGVVELLLRRAGIVLDPADNAAFEMWRLLAHAAAVIAGTAGRRVHSGHRPLGQALSMIGMKANAVNRLLTARGPAMADQIRRVTYLLARGGDAIPTNMTELRDLAAPDAGIAESAKRSIARAYYAAEDRKSREKAQ